MTYQFEEQYRVAPYDDLLQIYQHSFADNFPLPALTDYVNGKTICYGDLARRIARLHLFFELAGIVPGDKIALLGRNTPNWVITFMATVTYGAVIVPVLNDFNPADAQHIINHSDAVMLFVADGIFPSLDFEAMPELRAVVSLDTRTVIAERAPRCNETRRTPIHPQVNSHQPHPQLPQAIPRRLRPARHRLPPLRRRLGVRHQLHVGHHGLL